MAYALENFKTYFPDEEAYVDFRYMVGMIQRDFTSYNEISDLLRKYIIEKIQDPHDQMFGIWY